MQAALTRFCLTRPVYKASLNRPRAKWNSNMDALTNAFRDLAPTCLWSSGLCPASGVCTDPLTYPAALRGRWAGWGGCWQSSWPFWRWAQPPGQPAKPAVGEINSVNTSDSVFSSSLNISLQWASRSIFRCAPLFEVMNQSLSLQGF